MNPFGPTAKRIRCLALRLLEKNGPMAAAELAEQLDYPVNVVRICLRPLVITRFLRIEGKSPHYQYVRHDANPTTKSDCDITL